MLHMCIYKSQYPCQWTINLDPHVQYFAWVVCWVDPLGDLLFFGHLGCLLDGCSVLSFAFGTGKQLWVARLEINGRLSSSDEGVGAEISLKMMESNDFGSDDQRETIHFGEICHRKPVEYSHDVCGLSGDAKWWNPKWPQRTHPK